MTLKTFILVLGLVSAEFANAQGKVSSKQETGKEKRDVEEARKIMKYAESLRAARQAKSKVNVLTKEDDKKSSYDMDVLQGEGRKSYLEFTAPDEEVGRRMLAIQTKYWSKFPDSKRVVPISRREAIGNSAFAIADIYQMDVDHDYDPQIVGPFKEKGCDCLELELTAKHSGAPYHKIRYYVRAKDNYPVKAKFFGVSGKLLKTMHVEKSRKLAGKVRPTLSRMEDNVIKGRVSWWKTKNMRKTKIPDEVFTKAYLKGR